MAAQVTTLGKRIASAAEELLYAYGRLEELIGRYPLRGLKGPMGTAQDQLELFGGSQAMVKRLEQEVARHLGFSHVMISVGQIYPRSLDYEVLTALAQIAAGPSSLAMTMRLMAGQELLSEGFKPGQVGSSAMPHKMNARTCERINGFNADIHGYADMISRLSGTQWQEGDVSCSVVRRVALQGAFFAIDGLIESFLTVLTEYGPFPAMIEAELNHYLPFLTTTKILMEAVKRGVGREEAYAAIQEHSKAVAFYRLENGVDENDLYHRLGEDPRLPMTEAEIVDLVGEPLEFIGSAAQQVTDVARRIELIVAQHRDAANYVPGSIL